MMSNLEIENLEKKYLDFIVTFLQTDLAGLCKGLNSRIELLDDWKEQFMKTSRKGFSASDLDKGAERIFHHIFTQLFSFPNSTPIGSDLMYKSEEAIIQIEIKTNLLTNSDYKGKVQVGRNQISYETTSFKPNLPSVYRSVNLPTLTYVILIVHEHFSPVINALAVISVPNGQLSSIYGSGIIQSGKRGKKAGYDVRYNFSKEPKFLVKSDNEKKDIYRVEIIFHGKNFELKKLTGGKITLRPFKIF